MPFLRKMLAALPDMELQAYTEKGICYCTPRDNSTNYYFDLMPKGKRVIETQYYVDRPGTYETGTCTAECAYATEFRGKAHSMTLTVSESE